MDSHEGAIDDSNGGMTLTVWSEVGAKIEERIYFQLHMLLSWLLFEIEGVCVCVL